jgi:hypothetical protein
MKAHSIFYAISTTFAFLLFSAPASYAQSENVDWNLYGFAKLSNGSEDMCFYDSKSLEHRQNGFIRVWAKCLSENDADTALDNKDTNHDLVEAAAQKVAHYYLPVLSKIQKLNQNALIQVISYEAVADLGSINPHSQIFYEINCHEKMVHELSISANLDGKIGSSDKPTEWKYAPPESNGDNLIELLCPAS